jgi:aldehyde:ferredoxin oxidoreductase
MIMGVDMGIREIYGWVGKVCRVNLTSLEIKIEPTENYLERFVGGRGVGQSILFNELTPSIKALDPENIIVFGTGPLTGTLAPISGRLEIDSKNFVTGGVGSSNVGGHFGSELKYAGFDFIIIQGRATKPVYLWLSDEKVEIKDASMLWGKTTWETEDILTENDRRIRVLCIGPAGENKVKSACIIINKKHAAGRCGFGAIMGSKNLKAIAVRGTGSVKVSNPKKFFEALDKVLKQVNKSEAVTKRYRPTIGTHFNSNRANDSCTLPYRNFQDDHWPIEKFDKVGWEVFTKWKTRNLAEFNEPLYMSCFYEIPEENIKTEGFEQNHAWDYMGKLDINDPIGVLKTHILCNSLGLDIDNSSGVLAFAIELFEKGILTEKDTDGLKLSWGDTDSIIKMIKKLAYKEGKFGKLLALGVKRASEIIGKSSEKYAIHIKGQELAEGIRAAKGWALGVATATRGGGHLDGASMAGFQKISESLGLKKFGNPDAGKQNIYEGKGKVVIWFEKLKAVVDMCGIGYHSSFWVAEDLCDIPYYAELYSAVTGKNITEDEFARMGLQLKNLEKAFNTIHIGFKREDDFPPERLMREPVKTGEYKGEYLDPVKWGKMLDEYYELHSWDKKTGWQTRKCLEDLDMFDVLSVLEKEGKLIN